MHPIKLIFPMYLKLDLTILSGVEIFLLKFVHNRSWIITEFIS
jgi:hypothetical protein